MIDHSLYPSDAENDIEERFALADRCLHVYDVANGESKCDADDERHLAAEMRDYLETGRDRVIDLTSVWGSDIAIIASKVVNWVVSTRDSRLRSRSVTRAIEQAQRERDLLDGGND